MRDDGALERVQAKWFGGKAAKKQQAQGSVSRAHVAATLMKGFAITIGVAAMSLLLGLTLAIPAGILLNANKAPWAHIVRAFVDFIRGTPVLIQLFFVYFGAPQIGLTLSPLTSAVITLTINSSAYMSEVIRSGLMAINPGQAIAGKALGLSRLQVFRWVIWPQAFRIAMPPLVNSSVALLKDTALISVISVAEVIREAQSIISVTYNPMKYYLIVGLMFFIFTYPLMKLAGYVERTIKQRGFVS